MERREKSSGGGLGALAILGIGALVGAGIAYFANKISEEESSQTTTKGALTNTGKTPELTNTQQCNNSV